MTPQQRAILKHPGYVGRVDDLVMRHGMMRKPRLNEITFTKVPKTTVTCTYCFGQKKHIEDMGGLGVQSKCPNCQGTGQMEIDNREVKGYGL